MGRWHQFVASTVQLGCGCRELFQADLSTVQHHLQPGLHITMLAIWDICGLVQCSESNSLATSAVAAAVSTE